MERSDQFYYIWFSEKTEKWPNVHIKNVNFGSQSLVSLFYPRIYGPYATCKTLFYQLISSLISKHIESNISN